MKNIDESLIFDLLRDVRQYIEAVAEKTHEWYAEELPDYGYRLYLNPELEGIQMIEKYKE